MDFLSQMLSPMFAGSMGGAPVSFGSLSPATPPAATGAPLDIRSPIQQQQDAQAPKPGFDQNKFNTALGQLQKAAGPQQQSQVQWMKPMNLKPQGFGMLQGF